MSPCLRSIQYLLFTNESLNVPQAPGADDEDVVCLVQLPAEPAHLALLTDLEVLPQVQHHLQGTNTWIIPHLISHIIFILCSHMTTMAAWRATNTDKMATNSGQPGELQPCRFPILQSINYLDHMSQNGKIKNIKKQRKNGG